MPDEIQYDASATPAQFTNNADIVIEQGTHVRVKIIGLRTEVGEMWAIGSINGDFLGYAFLDYPHLQSIAAMLTVLLPAAAYRHRIPKESRGVLTGEEDKWQGLLM
jgi:DNA-directed RNA polymerase II subunit RPB7